MRDYTYIVISSQKALLQINLLLYRSRSHNRNRNHNQIHYPK